jgi:hypothetical protein
VEGAPVVRAGVRDVKELEEHQGGQRHGASVGEVAGAFDQAARERVVEHEERAYGHHEADEGYAGPTSFGE